MLMLPPLCCASEPVQLNWMGHWKGEGKRQQLVEEIKKEYEFLYPDVKVNLVYDVDLEGPGGYYKTNTAHAIAEMVRTGNITWDVIFLGVTVYNYVADIVGDAQWGQKHLVNFAEVPGFLESHEEFIVSTPYYREQSGGIFVGPLVEGLIMCPWYNKEVAETAGIFVPERGMTVDQFIEAARLLSEYNREHGTEVPFFNLSTFNRIDALFEYIFRTYLTDPHVTIEQNYSEEKAEAFLATLLIFEQLSHYQPMLNKGWRTLDFVQWQKDFLAGGGLFLPAGTFMHGHFQRNAPETMAHGVVVEPPYVRQPSSLVGQYSSVFAVMKNGPHQKEAMNLLKLWTEPVVAERWVEYTQNPTGLKRHVTDIRHSDADDDMYSDYIVDMQVKHHELPLTYYRAPTYLFGRDCKITSMSFRENLALILEGKQGGLDYYQELMELHGKRAYD